MYGANTVYRRSVVINVIVCVITYTCWVTADARTEYLVKMLETSDNYRLRVQAATTLGKLREKKAAVNLVTALSDKNELVVISAAIALKQIGDPSVLVDVENALKKTESAAARSQLGVTVRILREIDGSIKTKKTKVGKKRFLVRVDAMGNSSKMRDHYLTQIMKKIVAERIEAEGDIILQDESMDDKIVKSKKKNDKIEAYIISGAILRLDKAKGSITVKLGLNLFSNPEYSLLMMPTSEAAISVNDEKYDAAKPKEIERALRIVSDSLINSIFNTLRQSMSN